MSDPVLEQMQIIRKVYVARTVERAVEAVLELDDIDLPARYKDIVIAVIRGAGRDWED